MCGILSYFVITPLSYSPGTIPVRGGADCIALLWGNGLYCKLKLKREEEELITRLEYLNKYSGC